MKGQSVHYKVLAFRILSSFAEMISCDQNPFLFSLHGLKGNHDELKRGKV